jgi:frataxin
LTAAAAKPVAFPSRKFFSTGRALWKGIMPDSDKPVKEPAKTEVTMTVAEISDAKYHEVADEYLDTILARFEEMQDRREDVDVEFSVGTTFNYKLSRS